MVASIISLADRYFLLIHKALALFLPAPLMTRLEKRSYVLDSFELVGPLKGSVSIHHFVSRTFAPEDLSKYLIPKTVIIFPDDMMLTVFMENYKNQKNIFILKNEATAAKRSQAWIDIYE
jgi:hypothetical protein